MKPILLYTRPLGWERVENCSLDVRYVPLCGERPMRKNGKPASDGHYARAIKVGIDDLISTMHELQPQYLLRWVHPALSPKTLRAVRNASPKTKIVLAEGNSPDRVSSYVLRFRKLIDGVLLNSDEPKTKDSYVSEGFRRPGTLWEAPYEPSTPEVSSRQRDYDIFFGGSNRRKRDGEWVFPLGQFRLQLIKTMRKKFRMLLRGIQREWPFQVYPVLADSNYLHQFERAKIALCCNQYRLRQYYTRRLFHAGASGAMPLVHYIPGMEEHFENHKHLVWFETVDEAVELARHYLDNKAARERIALEGREYFLSEQSWKVRLRSVERQLPAMFE